MVFSMITCSQACVAPFLCSKLMMLLCWHLMLCELKQIFDCSFCALFSVFRSISWSATTYERLLFLCVHPYKMQRLACGSRPGFNDGSYLISISCRTEMPERARKYTYMKSQIRLSLLSVSPILPPSQASVTIYVSRGAGNRWCNLARLRKQPKNEAYFVIGRSLIL